MRASNSGAGADDGGRGQVLDEADVRGGTPAEFVMSTTMKEPVDTRLVYQGGWTEQRLQKSKRRSACCAFLARVCKM